MCRGLFLSLVCHLGRRRRLHFSSVAGRYGGMCTGPLAFCTSVCFVGVSFPFFVYPWHMHTSLKDPLLCHCADKEGSARPFVPCSISRGRCDFLPAARSVSVCFSFGCVYVSLPFRRSPVGGPFVFSVCSLRGRLYPPAAKCPTCSFGRLTTRERRSLSVAQERFLRASTMRPS